VKARAAALAKLIGWSVVPRPGNAITKQFRGFGWTSATPWLQWRPQPLWLDKMNHHPGMDQHYNKVLNINLVEPS